MPIQNTSLSGRKVVATNKEMTLLERIYLVSILKGLWLTIKHLFRKKITIQYPEQKREFTPVSRGLHVLMRDEEGRERCTACGMCALACPAEAITMTAAERKIEEEHLYREEKYAKIYEINMLRCIFCGLCEDACPKEAIFLTKSKQLVKPKLDRESMIYGKDKLVISVEDAKNGKYN